MLLFLIKYRYSIIIGFLIINKKNKLSLIFNRYFSCSEKYAVILNIHHAVGNFAIC
jgi:hypothetical protein